MEGSQSGPALQDDSYAFEPSRSLSLAVSVSKSTRVGDARQLYPYNAINISGGVGMLCTAGPAGISFDLQPKVVQRLRYFRVDCLWLAPDSHPNPPPNPLIVGKTRALQHSITAWRGRRE